MFLGYREAGVNISEIADLMGFPCKAVSRVYPEWCAKQKTLFVRPCWWGLRRMTRIVQIDRKVMVTQINTLYNQSRISECTEDVKSRDRWDTTAEDVGLYSFQPRT